MKGSDISKNRPCYFKKMGLKSSKPCYLRCVLESEIFGFNKAETLVRDLTPLPNMCVCGGGGLSQRRGSVFACSGKEGAARGQRGRLQTLGGNGGLRRAVRLREVPGVAGVGGWLSGFSRGRGGAG